MRYVFLSALYLLILFLVSRYIFEPTYLYYELVWLDIPMHFLGGLGVAALSISIARVLHVPLPLMTLFLLYLCAAVSWEVYEYVRGTMVYDSAWKYLDSV